jgi:hypothetical protein
MRLYGIAKTFPTVNRSVHRMQPTLASWSTGCMGKYLAKRGLATGIGAGAFLVLGSAMAAPPQNRPVQARVQSQIQAPGQRLDLRAPSPAVDASEKTSSLPSMSRRRSLGLEEAVRLPALGADGMRSRATLQDFVRRVRHEGLPVARLFESKSTLVHLGLGPKGKPGLWLVQKTR